MGLRPGPAFGDETGRSEGAVSALARTHPQAGPPPNVVDAARPMLVEEGVQHRPRHEFALADERRIAATLGLMLRQPVTEPIRLAGDLAGQDGVGRGAGLGHAELRADRVDGVLGHEPEGRELAANDRDVVVDPVPVAVVDDRVGSRDRAVVAGLDVGGWLVERANAGIGPQQAHLAKPREEFLAFGDERRHFLAADLIHIRVCDADVGGAEDGDGVDGDHDVAVAGLVTAVDDRVRHTLVVDEHHALAGPHLELYTGQGRNLTCPRAGRRHHEPDGDLGRRAGAFVTNGRGHYPLPCLFKCDDAVVGPGLAAVSPGVG